jgi:hypothetical protein
MITKISFLVATHLGVGMMASLLVVSPRYLGAKFYRFISIIALVLLLLAQLANHASPASRWLWAAAALVLAFIATLPLRFRQLNRLVLVCAVACSAVALALISVPSNRAGIPGFVFTMDVFLSALALGSVMTCMILGHWYLVQPGMSIRPLQLTAGLFIAAVAARAALSSYTSVVVWRDFAAAGGDPWSNLVLTHLLFFGQRVLFGLVLPLALSWMIWQTVKIRSTQSATGILYVAVVFMLFGEFLSRYILVATGYPL